GSHVADHRALEVDDGSLVLARRQDAAEREARLGVVGGPRDDIAKEWECRFLAVEVEDDLRALPVLLDVAVRGRRGELAQPRPPSCGTAVALRPVAGHPFP